MMNGLVSNSHAVSQLTYHLEWCPEYRRNIFSKEENRQLCEMLVREVAARHRIEPIELFVMPNHVKSRARGGAVAHQYVAWHWVPAAEGRHELSFAAREAELPQGLPAQPFLEPWEVREMCWRLGP